MNEYANTKDFFNFSTTCPELSTKLLFFLHSFVFFYLDGAKKKLKQNKDEVVNSVEMVKSLKAIKSFLVEMKESL